MSQSGRGVGHLGLEQPETQQGDDDVLHYGPLKKTLGECIDGCVDDEEFDELLDRVIQDPALKRYYTIRD
jgi:hypothetical protein